WPPMAELTLGSLNLHMGRGASGHDAPFYDVVTACKEVDTDVLALQEAWVPDGEEGDVVAIASALGYRVAGTFSVARATCHDQVRPVAREGDAGDGDWVVALLSRLPVLEADVVTLRPQLARDPGRRAVVRAVVDAGGTPVAVATTHLPLLTAPVWRLARSLRAALPPADVPGVLAGDMNMWGWCVDLLVGRGWRRAVRGRTYPSPRPHSQTDHLLVNDRVEVVAAEVVPQVLSDHRPVRARLRV
ncbi:MAG TPA: endonuclease/exonuclease/phosphatase family protein, partial [Acidimicrobiales bacterium]|nr:endonuclease/exonuclease/phosphatase family protein [Acidimicrobiales bacterium]